MLAAIFSLSDKIMPSNPSAETVSSALLWIYFRHCHGGMEIHSRYVMEMKVAGVPSWNGNGLLYFIYFCAQPNLISPYFASVVNFRKAPSPKCARFTNETVI